MANPYSFILYYGTCETDNNFETYLGIVGIPKNLLHSRMNLLHD